MNSKSPEDIDRLLFQLRSRLNDVLENHVKFDNDFYLYRWLLQNKMNVERTENIIRKSIHWRKENNVEELVEKEWAFFAPGLENEVKMDFEGFTKAGRPLTTSNGESLDLRALLQKYGKDSIHKYFIQFYAKLEKCMMDHYKYGPIPCSSKNSCSGSGSGSDSIANGMSILTSNPNSNLNSNNPGGNYKSAYNPLWFSAAPIHVVSYKKFPLWNTTCVEGVQIMIEGASIGMTYFPAAVSAVYFVNLNKFSNLVLKMLKPIITTDVLNLEFYGTDQCKWSKVLLEQIDADQLPPYFGGSKTKA